MASGHVVACSHDSNGNVMGMAHTNLMLDTRTYQVEFMNGKVTELTTKIISESMYTQCDIDGNKYLILEVLVDYHKDNKAILLSEQQIKVQGRPETSKTTAGWQFCCLFKDDSSSWEKLFNLKESHLVQTADLLLCRGFIMSLLLTGGLSMCSKKETE